MTTKFATKTRKPIKLTLYSPPSHTFSFSRSLILEFQIYGKWFTPIYKYKGSIFRAEAFRRRGPRGAFGSAGRPAKSAKYILPKRGGGFSPVGRFIGSDAAYFKPLCNLLISLKLYQPLSLEFLISTMYQYHNMTTTPEFRLINNTSCQILWKINILKLLLSAQSHPSRSTALLGVNISRT